MLSMVPKECACSLRCCANMDVWLLLQNASLCSLYRIANDLPVCPTHALLQSGQVNLYTLLVKIYWGSGFLA